MNLIILCHVLEILYFIFILAVFYCYLLTPARSRKTTFWLSVLFMLPDAVLMALNYEKIHLFHWVIILLPLVFLFSDPVEKRISCYVLLYFSMLLCEIAGAIICCFVLSVQSGHFTAPFSLNAFQSCLYLFSIVVFSSLLLPRLAPLLERLLEYIDGIALILIGLPVISCLLSHSLITLARLPAWFIFPVFLFSYYLLHRGLIRIHQYEFHRQQLKSQKLLIEGQLSYSRELEKEYQQLRRWNHDIGNHFQALAFLLESQKYEEGKSYIRELLEKEF